jgi:hypothetical protein
MRTQGLPFWCVALGTLGLVLGACLLPLPPEPAPLPNLRPFIVRASVIPAPEKVMTVLPKTAIVPVELVDPSVRFEWRLYVDYANTAVLDDPTNPDDLGGRVASGVSVSDGTGSSKRVLEIPLSAVGELPGLGLSPDRCHLIEVLVAQAFVGPSRREGHTARPPGGDTVSWFYSPNGTFEGCPTQVVVPSDVPIQDAGGQ